MKKISLSLLFLVLIVFACEEEKLCKSSTGTLIIKNNLGTKGYQDRTDGITELVYLVIFVDSYDRYDQIWNDQESDYISSKYHVYQLKEGKYRVRAEWGSSRQFKGEIELYINSCQETTLSIPSLNINYN